MIDTKLDPIAIIGLGALFPGSNDPRGFWQTIIDGSDQITEVPPTHWLISDYFDPNPHLPDKTYCKWGAFVSPSAFDPVGFGIPPGNIPQTNATQLLALITAQQLLKDVFGDNFDKNMDLSRSSVILGITSGQELASQASGRLQYPIWQRALREAGIPKDIEDQICQRVSNSYTPWGESLFPGMLGNVVSGRIANRFNFGGTNCVLDAACASSLAAISMAIDELQLGRTDLVVTGGADTFNDIFMYMCFSKTPALSPSGMCRPFAKAADGTLLGEGLGFIALKRLADAERDNNKIYAVIRGLGASSDGRAKSIYAPVAEGQAVAIRRSYAAAGFDPHTIELIEAHGTGTLAGDAAEMSGLKLAFMQEEVTAKPWCAVGSVKSQIGHTKAAAGAAALIKAIFALRHKTLPPTIKVDEPNPALGIAGSPFYLNTKARPWVRTADHPRRAGVSAFGFGGTNFHIALEEYQGPGKLAPRLRTMPAELILLSAISPQALLTVITQKIEEAAAKNSLAYIAKQSQQQFSTQHISRLAIVAKDEADLVDKLQQVREKIAKDPQSAQFLRDIYYTNNHQPGKIALLFPGQGSQYPNMGADLLMAFDAAQALWGEVDAIPLDTANKLHEVVFPPPVFTPGEELAQQRLLAMTQWTQPALAATSAMQFTLLQSLGIKADCYAGHSFGELVALYAAGVFDLQTLVKVARKRGELMAQAGNIPGAMTAVIYADMPALLQKIRDWKLEVTPANFNSPEQIVFSGSQAAIADLENKLRVEKISFHHLPVSTAFHSQIIQESQQPFLEYLKTLTFSKPTQPVYANTTAAIYPDAAEQIKEYLAKQLLNPVHFVEQIEAMYKAGVRVFIEAGPQGILTNFVKKILSGKDFHAISLDNKQQCGITNLWNALGQLAVIGIPINCMPLWQEYMEPTKPAAPTNKKFTLPISGTSYGKPYPPSGGAQDLPKPNPPGSIPSWAKENDDSLLIDKRFEPMLLNNHKQTANGIAENESVSTEGTADFDRINKILDIYQKMQEEVTKAHVEYQTLTEKSHLAYLEEARIALDDIRDLAMGLESATKHHAPHLSLHTESSATTAVTPTPTLPKIEAPHVVPVQQMQAPPAFAPAPAVPASLPKLAVSQPIMPEQISTDVDPVMQATIMAIVADKTGYPEDTLSMDMNLEADLGIDSIKRVEIFSAMQEKIPNLPELDLTKLAGLHTFREIADYVKKQQGV